MSRVAVGTRPRSPAARDERGQRGGRHEQGAGGERGARGERGFTLVEAVVALGLFSIVLGSTGLIVVRALAGTGTTDRAVTAVMVADQALENARTISAQTSSGGTPALVEGRTPALVGAVPVTDLALTDTALAYGPGAAAGPALPLTGTTTVDGTPYSVRLVIGTCLRDRAGGSCDLATTHVSPVTLYRVIAAVTWPGCASRSCPVTATTLVDPAPDPAFNALQDTLPVAVAKCFSTSPNQTLRFDPTYKTYTLRDTGDLGSAPVHVVVAPATGTLTQNTGSRTWTYVPGHGSYTDQFTYTLTDRYNHVSNTATIRLQVGGAAC
jgi:type II secretory pathway pseudopilin PulG